MNEEIQFTLPTGKNSASASRWDPSSRHARSGPYLLRAADAALFKPKAKRAQFRTRAASRFPFSYNYGVNRLDRHGGV